MQTIRKIHFINRIDYDNVGDWNCCPLCYYYDFFKDFTLIRHEIDYINFNEIERDDVVIFGGGGILYVTESFNSSISFSGVADSTHITIVGLLEVTFKKLIFQDSSLLELETINIPLDCPTYLVLPLWHLNLIFQKKILFHREELALLDIRISLKNMTFATTH